MSGLFDVKYEAYRIDYLLGTISPPNLSLPKDMLKVWLLEASERTTVKTDSVEHNKGLNKGETVGIPDVGSGLVTSTLTQDYPTSPRMKRPVDSCASGSTL